MPANRTVFNVRCDLFESRQSVIEELPVAFAKITLSLFVFIIRAQSVFHTPAPADVEVPANKALVTKFLLFAGECSFFAIAGKLFQRRFENVA